MLIQSKGKKEKIKLIHNINSTISSFKVILDVLNDPTTLNSLTTDEIFPLMKKRLDDLKDDWNSLKSLIS